MNNLPLFEKRWKSRQAGDTRLMRNPNDWKLWKNRIVELASQYGMAPNAFVDGVTCAVIAHSVYRTKYDKYTKQGFEHGKAYRKARLDAELAYNLTQQSSEGAMVSAIQMDRTVAANALSVFRNSSMAYTRQAVDGLRNLRHMLGKGYKEASTQFMKGQLMVDGLSEDQAARAAESEYKKARWKNLAKVGVMAFVLPMLWNMGPMLGYLLLGGDDDEAKKRAAEDAVLKGLLGGPVEGLAGGSIISDMVGLTVSSEGLSMEGLKNYEVNPLPLFSDVQGMLSHFSYDEVAGMEDLLAIAMQSATGVNPHTVTDMIDACIDYSHGDMLKAREIELFIMRVMNAPSATSDNLYIDELGMSNKDARKLSYEEMARRYADYKYRKEVPLMGWLHSDEAEEKRKESLMKQFEKKVSERLSGLDDEQLYHVYQDGDNDMRKLSEKEIGKRTDGGEDVIGKSSSKKADVKAAVEYYRKHRTYLDLLEDMKLDGFRKKVSAGVDAGVGTVSQEQLDLMQEVGRVIKELRRERDKMKPDGANDVHWESIRRKREDVLRKIERVK